MFPYFCGTFAFQWHPIDTCSSWQTHLITPAIIYSTLHTITCMPMSIKAHLCSLKHAWGLLHNVGISLDLLQIVSGTILPSLLIGKLNNQVYVLEITSALQMLCGCIYVHLLLSCQGRGFRRDPVAKQESPGQRSQTCQTQKSDMKNSFLLHALLKSSWLADDARFILCVIYSLYYAIWCNVACSSYRRVGAERL